MNEDRKIGSGVFWVVIFAVISVILLLAATVWVTVSNGTFCTTASVIVCGLALFAATAKRPK